MINERAGVAKGFGGLLNNSREGGDRGKLM